MLACAFLRLCVGTCSFNFHTLIKFAKPHTLSLTRSHTRIGIMIRVQAVPVSLLTRTLFTTAILSGSGWGMCLLGIHTNRRTCTSSDTTDWMFQRPSSVYTSFKVQITQITERRGCMCETVYVGVFLCLPPCPLCTGASHCVCKCPVSLSECCFRMCVPVCVRESHRANMLKYVFLFLLMGK